MIWVVLGLLGVPLWLCAAGIFVLLHNSRTLRKRPGNIPVRILRPDGKRWRRGHGIWVSDVFAWRSSPAGWNEDLRRMIGASVRSPTPKEHRKLRRLDQPVVADLLLDGGETMTLATEGSYRELLAGPHAHPPPASTRAADAEAGVVRRRDA